MKLEILKILAPAIIHTPTQTKVHTWVHMQIPAVPCDVVNEKYLDCTRSRVFVGPRLPDGLFSDQKSQFGYILDGLTMEDVCVIYVWTFSLLCEHLIYYKGHLVYFMVIWCIFSPFWCIVPRKIWQPWWGPLQTCSIIAQPINHLRPQPSNEMALNARANPSKNSKLYRPFVYTVLYALARRREIKRNLIGCVQGDQMSL
jgi:hypothetical protein